MVKIYNFKKFKIRKKIKSLQNDIADIYSQNDMQADLYWLQHSRIVTLKQKILELNKELENLEIEEMGSA